MRAEQEEEATPAPIVLTFDLYDAKDIADLDVLWGLMRPIARPINDLTWESG